MVYHRISNMVLYVLQQEIVFLIYSLYKSLGLPQWLSGKESTCQCKRLGFDPWSGKIPCRRKCQPTLVFLPGKARSQRSLVSYSPWGRKELDMTWRLNNNVKAYIADPSLPLHPPPGPLPLGNHWSVLFVCDSASVLQIGSFVTTNFTFNLRGNSF